MKNMLIVRFAALLLLLGFPVFKLSATPITPEYDTFGSQPGVTFVPFGGPYSGIPNDAVAMSNINGTLLGGSATARYSNQVVQNDGMGNFYAKAGGDVLNGKPGYGTWNVDIYIANLLAGQTWKLLYGLNPLIASSAAFTAAADYQDSWNLGMAFLGAGFNPDAIGTYGFSLVLYGAPVGLEAPLEVGRTAFNVIVGDGIAPPKVDTPTPAVPDGGSTAALMELSVLCLMGLSRKIQSRLNTPSLTPIAT